MSIKAENGHDLQGVDDIAHQALKLAQQLQKEVNKNPLQAMLDRSKENASWFAIYASGIILFSMLIAATARLYNNQSQLGNSGITWEIYTYMLIATVSLGIYLIFAINNMLLGNNVIYYALFVSTIAFAIGLFMTIVAVRTRILPH
jgi:hypothetical protein